MKLKILKTFSFLKICSLCLFNAWSSNCFDTKPLCQRARTNVNRTIVCNPCLITAGIVSKMEAAFHIRKQMGPFKNRSE